MASELERLAKRARDDAARAESLAEARAERKELARRAYADKLVRDSLSSSHLAPIIAVVGFATFMCVAFFVAKTGLPLAVRRVVSVTSLVLAFASFGGLGLYPRWRGAREIGWMTALPFEVQVRAYLADLGREHASGRPQVRVAFEKAPAPHDRETITLGVEQILETASVSWYGDHLLVAGPVVQTRFEGHDRPGGGAGTLHHNGRAHRWVRKCLAKALPVVHEQHPIRVVSPSIG